jgi:hypothetical protein
VAERDGAGITIRLFTWGRAAVAAIIVLAIGGVVWMQSTRPAVVEELAIVPPPAIAAPTGVIEVSGPALAAATQAPVEEIAIGPSPLAQQQAVNYAAAEDLIYRVPRVVIASGAVKRQDNGGLLPF